MDVDNMSVVSGSTDGSVTMEFFSGKDFLPDLTSLFPSERGVSPIIPFQAGSLSSAHLQLITCPRKEASSGVSAHQTADVLANLVPSDQTALEDSQRDLFELFPASDNGAPTNSILMEDNCVSVPTDRSPTHTILEGDNNFVSILGGPTHLTLETDNNCVFVPRGPTHAVLEEENNCVPVPGHSTYAVLEGDMACLSVSGRDTCLELSEWIKSHPELMSSNPQIQATSALATCSLEPHISVSSHAEASSYLETCHQGITCSYLHTQEKGMSALCLQTQEQGISASCLQTQEQGVSASFRQTQEKEISALCLETQEQGINDSFVQTQEKGINASCLQTQEQGYGASCLQTQEQGISCSCLQINAKSQPWNSSQVMQKISSGKTDNVNHTVNKLASFSSFKMSVPGQCMDVFPAAKEELREATASHVIAEHDDGSTGSCSTLAPPVVLESLSRVLPHTSLTETLASDSVVNAGGSVGSSPESEASLLLLKCPRSVEAGKATGKFMIRRMQHFTTLSTDAGTLRLSSYKKKVSVEQAEQACAEKTEHANVEHIEQAHAEQAEEAHEHTVACSTRYSNKKKKAHVIQGHVEQTLSHCTRSSNHKKTAHIEQACIDQTLSHCTRSSNRRKTAHIEQACIEQTLSCCTRSSSRKKKAHIAQSHVEQTHEEHLPHIDTRSSSGFLDIAIDNCGKACHTDSGLSGEAVRHSGSHSVITADRDVGAGSWPQTSYGRQLHRLVALYDRMLDKLSTPHHHHVLLVDGKDQLEKFEQILHKLTTNLDRVRTRLLSTPGKQRLAWQKQLQQVSQYQTVLDVARDKHQLLKHRVWISQTGNNVPQGVISQQQLQTSTNVDPSHCQQITSGSQQLQTSTNVDPSHCQQITSGSQQLQASTNIDPSLCQHITSGSQQLQTYSHFNSSHCQRKMSSNRLNTSIKQCEVMDYHPSQVGSASVSSQLTTEACQSAAADVEIGQITTANGHIQIQAVVTDGPFGVEKEQMTTGSGIIPHTQISQCPRSLCDQTVCFVAITSETMTGQITSSDVRQSTTDRMPTSNLTCSGAPSDQHVPQSQAGTSMTLDGEGEIHPPFTTGEISPPLTGGGINHPLTPGGTNYPLTADEISPTLATGGIMNVDAVCEVQITNPTRELNPKDTWTTAAKASPGYQTTNCQLQVKQPTEVRTRDLAGVCAPIDRDMVVQLTGTTMTSQVWVTGGRCQAQTHPATETTRDVKYSLSQASSLPVLGTADIGSRVPLVLGTVDTKSSISTSKNTVHKMATPVTTDSFDAEVSQKCCIPPQAQAVRYHSHSPSPQELQTHRPNMSISVANNTITRNKSGSPTSTVSSSLFVVTSKELARRIQGNPPETHHLNCQSRTLQTGSISLHDQMKEIVKPKTFPVISLQSVGTENLDTMASLVKHASRDEPRRGRQLVPDLAASVCPPPTKLTSLGVSGNRHSAVIASSHRKRGRPRTKTTSDVQRKKARCGHSHSKLQQGQIQRYFPLLSQPVVSERKVVTNCHTQSGVVNTSHSTGITVTNCHTQSRAVNAASITGRCVRDGADTGLECTHGVSINSNTNAQTHKKLHLSTVSSSDAHSMSHVNSVDISMVMRNLRTVLLIADEEVICTNRDFPADFWNEDFTNIRMSESFWESLDVW